MALNCVQIDAPPDAVFDCLLDPGTYPDWLVGAKRIRAVDDGWPAVGTRFHHRVGAGPVMFDDWSEVRRVERPGLLQLSVRVTPLIRATVTMTLRGDGSSSLLCIEEEPEHRVVGNLLRPVLDPLTHFRNHYSIRRLKRLVESAGAGRSA